MQVVGGINQPKNFVLAGSQIIAPLAGCERVFGESEYIVLGEQSEWQNKQTAYKELSFNPAFTNIIDPALSSFVTNVQNENIAKVVWIDEMIKQLDLFAAKNLVNGLTPENLMEQNYQSFIICLSAIAPVTFDLLQKKGFKK